MTNTTSQPVGVYFKYGMQGSHFHYTYNNWSGSPIVLGMTIVWFSGMTVCALFEDYNYCGSSIKDFEDDSGCAFEDDRYHEFLFGFMKTNKKKNEYLNN